MERQWQHLLAQGKGKVSSDGANMLWWHENTTTMSWFRCPNAGSFSLRLIQTFTALATQKLVILNGSFLMSGDQEPTARPGTCHPVAQSALEK